MIVNPRASGSRTGRAFAGLEATARRALGPLDTCVTERRGHAVELARAAAEEGRPLIVAVGGDGTLSEVVNGVLGSRRPEAAVGFIAQGTGGDFPRSLAIGSDPTACLEAIASGRERCVDVGLLTFRETDGGTGQRYFLNIVSAGLGGLVDRYIAATPAWLGGRLGYYMAALRAIWLCPEAQLRCRLTLDTGPEEHRLRARVVAVCNGGSFGSGMLMAPMAKVDDGVLELISVTQPTRLHMLVRSRTIYDGSHLRLRGVEHLRCRRVELDVEDEAVRPHYPLDVDGEALGLLPMAAEVVPRALVLRA